ncbi:non-specific lipid-transfer protein 1-like [Phalaenopsis equestris]|uniref:non-specific lipid-transfer protein 1-like n=1 Tax=Phalaenopsis equestris TaxID=78828 RepID=UPI0009E2B375|nr:non-specific lipid-transfer protein 1-like [Phalaenopsis equestris]
MISRPTTTALVAAVLVAAVVALPSSKAALSCSEVYQQLMPCVDYLQSGGSSAPSALCCNGISSLNAEAKVRADRQTVCRCLKTAASGATDINIKLAEALPKKCGVNIPYKISTSMDCAKVN